MGIQRVSAEEAGVPSGGTLPGLEVELPIGVAAPSLARDALAPFLEWRDDETRFRLDLLISELVTNAVRHSSGWVTDPILVRVLAVDDRMHVEVRDAGRSSDDVVGPLAPVPHPRSSGWGLWLLDRLADVWGVDRSAGTTVWFELRDRDVMRRSA
jgi:anti-sigma regulatory factor (Ser/Thr protein kinase)